MSTSDYLKLSADPLHQEAGRLMEQDADRIAELEAALKEYASANAKWHEENKRLREAIDKAPHSHDCKANREGVKNCSYWCWKLSALENE